MRVRPLLFVLVFAIALPACVAELRAQDILSELEQAKRHYTEGHFADAVLQLRALLPALERERDRQARRARLADAYCHLGLSYAALDDNATAKDAFKNVLQLNPAYHLDPQIHSPKVIALFEQARLAVAALEPPLPRGAIQSRRPPGAWGVELEGGMGSARRAYLTAAPGPTFAPPQEHTYYPDSFYFLPLRSKASGSGGFLRAALAPHGSVSRFELRYAWLSASDGTAVPLHAELTQVLRPPASDGSEELRLRWLDALWSRSLAQRHGFSARLELGYRYARTRQTARDVLRDSRCTDATQLTCSYHPCGEDPTSEPCRFASAAVPVRYIRRELIRRSASLDDHGARTGIDLEVRLHRALRLVARGGATMSVRRETGSVDWECQNNPEPASFFPALGTEYSAAGGPNLTFDLSAGLRVDLARRASLRATYRLEDLGPEGRAASTGRILVGGLWLTLACSLGR